MHTPESARIPVTVNRPITVRRIIRFTGKLGIRPQTCIMQPNSPVTSPMIRRILPVSMTLRARVAPRSNEKGTAGNEMLFQDKAGPGPTVQDATIPHHCCTLTIAFVYAKSYMDSLDSGCRGLMFKRRTHNTGLRILAALALVVAVLTSPIRPTKWLGAGGERDCLRRNFALAKVSPLPCSVKQVPSRLVQVKAIASETDEEEFTGAVRSAVSYFDLHSTPSTKPGRNPISPGLALTIHPLRC